MIEAINSEIKVIIAWCSSISLGIFTSSTGVNFFDFVFESDWQSMRNFSASVQSWIIILSIIITTAISVYKFLKSLKK